MGKASFNVLLVEGDRKQTELLTELVREIAPDARVDTTARADATLEWLARSNYHLVVLDTATIPGSPGIDTLGLLERIRRISPVTSVILIAENATVEQAVVAIRLGAEDYIKKPFNLETVQLAIKRSLDRKAVLAEDAGASSFLNLLNSCQMISASLEQSKIFGIVQSYFLREVKSAHCAIYSLQGNDPIRIDQASDTNRQDRAMDEILAIALQVSNPMPGMRDAGEIYRFVERGQLSPGTFIFRFRCASDVDFFCVALSPERPSDMEGFESRLRMLKTQIEMTGKNIEQYLGVQHLVYVDDATGLYNTRYLHYILDREITQSNTTGKSFAVLFIDADKFKSVNDSHGHLVGTKLLNELGHQLKKYVRDTDTVFRYGGDEFVAVLAPCDLKTAQTVAERIRQSVEALSFLSFEGLGLHFTVSIGVALYPDHANSKQAVIDAADHAMYAAKNRTRNSVFVAPLGAPDRTKVKAIGQPASQPTQVEDKSSAAPAAPAPKVPSGGKSSGRA